MSRHPVRMSSVRQQIGALKGNGEWALSAHSPVPHKMVCCGQATGASSSVFAVLPAPCAIAGLQKRMPISWSPRRSASDKSG